MCLLAFGLCVFGIGASGSKKPTLIRIVSEIPLRYKGFNFGVVAIPESVPIQQPSVNVKNSWSHALQFSLAEVGGHKSANLESVSVDNQIPQWGVKWISSIIWRDKPHSGLHLAGAIYRVIGMEFRWRSARIGRSNNPHIRRIGTFARFLNGFNVNQKPWALGIDDCFEHSAKLPSRWRGQLEQQSWFAPPDTKQPPGNGRYDNQQHAYNQRRVVYPVSLNVDSGDCVNRYMWLGWFVGGCFWLIWFTVTPGVFLVLSGRRLSGWGLIGVGIVAAIVAGIAGCWGISQQNKCEEYHDQQVFHGEEILTQPLDYKGFRQ